MSEEFGSDTGDAGQSQDGSFNRDGGDQTTSGEGQATITSEDLAKLLKRDASAQEHIPQIETENDTLRTKVAELQAQVDSATTLEDVVARISQESGQSSNEIDPETIAATIEARLEAKSQKKVEQTNWDSVVSQLETKYGDWDGVDKAITAKCSELSMDPQEATQLARKNPKVFMKIFETGQGHESSLSPASQTNTQSSVINPTGPLVDGKSRQEWKDYYNTMRKEKPAQWSKMNVQKELWARVYGT